MFFTTWPSSSLEPYEPTPPNGGPAMARHVEPIKPMKPEQFSLPLHTKFYQTDFLDQIQLSQPEPSLWSVLCILLIQVKLMVNSMLTTQPSKWIGVRPINLMVQSTSISMGARVAELRSSTPHDLPSSPHGQPALRLTQDHISTFNSSPTCF